MKWEYKVLTLAAIFKTPGHYKWGSIQADFNAMGREGWEFVGEVGKIDTRLVFKRPVKDGK